MRLRLLLARTPALVLLGPAVVALVVMAAKQAGYQPATWYPAALFLAGLLVVGLVTVRDRPPALVVAAIAALGGFTAWSYASIGWAAQKGDAWDAANLTLLYTVVFALFALWRLRAPVAAALLAGLTVGIAGIALVELLKAGGATDPGAYFPEGRFAAPATYQNAAAGLWTIALWPGIALASRRELPSPVRALMAATAVVLASAALLAQSRGWLFATPITALVFVAVMPNRVRLLLTGLLVAAAVLAINGRLLQVFEAAGGHGFSAAVADAVRAIVLAAAAVAALVGAAAAVERARERPSRSTERRAGRVALGMAALAGVAALAIFVAQVGSPFTALADGWHSFKTQSTPQGKGSRFGQSLGSNRYDFWRVALDQFAAQPVTGAGADNFQEYYLAHRHSHEQPRFPHSVELRTLSQTGLVGTGLLAAGLGCAVAAALLARRRRIGLGAAVAGAGLAAFASWLIHGSVDWFWEFPGLGVAAFAALGLAAGLLPRLPAGRRQLVRGPAIGALGVAALAGVWTLGAPWMAQHWVNDAAANWHSDAGRAFQHLDSAAALNGLSANPYLFGGAIALELRGYDAAEAWFRKAQERDPGSHYAELELGMLAARAGRRGEALQRLGHAVALNPGDAATRGALRRVRLGRPVGLEAVNRELAQQSRNVIRR